MALDDAYPQVQERSIDPILPQNRIRHMEKIEFILVKVDVRKLVLDPKFRIHEEKHMRERIGNEIIAGNYGAQGRYMSVALMDDNTSEEVTSADVEDMWIHLKQRSSSSECPPRFPVQEDLEKLGAGRIDLIILDGPVILIPNVEESRVLPVRCMFPRYILPCVNKLVQSG